MRYWQAVMVGAAVLAVACGGRSGIDVDGGATMKVSSSAFSEGDTIPARFTCDGDDARPDLAWSEAPDGAVGIAVVVDDPDAPGGTFTHWTVWGLAPQDSPLEERLPGRATEGTNDFGQVGYRGPCPPSGDAPHTYRFRVLALDSAVDLARGATPSELAEAVSGHVVAEGRLTATYGR